MRTLVLLALALLVAGCVTQPAATTAPDVPPANEVARLPLAATGCRELLVQAPITVERARAFVPANYSLVGEASGRALAFTALKLCDDLTVANASFGEDATSDSGVFIEAPDGSDGFHYYQTWWLTSNPRLHARLVELGWNASLVNETTLNAPSLAGTVGEAGAHVAWDAGAFSIRAQLGAGGTRATNRAVGWYDGTHGTIRVVKTLATTEIGGGPALFEAPQGGPMSELMGGTAARGPALWNVYDEEGAVERAAPGLARAPTAS